MMIFIDDVAEYTQKLELVYFYLPEGKYWVYPRMVYRLAIVLPRDTVWLEEFPK